MGQMKRFQELQCEKEEIAKTIAMKADCLCYCEDHQEYYDNSGNLQDAYIIAAAMISDKKELVKDFKSQRGLTDLIKKVVNEAPDECTECENINIK